MGGRGQGVQYRVTVSLTLQVLATEAPMQKYTYIIENKYTNIIYTVQGDVA